MKIIEAKDDNECSVFSYEILKRFSQDVRFPFRPDLHSVCLLISGRDKYARFVVTESGKLCGGMLCLKLNHPLNQSVFISSEIFFYINRENRKGREALKLIKGYSEWCHEEGINICTLVATPDSPQSIDKLYNKYGFYQNERTYVRWQV